MVHTLEAGPLPPPTRRFTVPPGLNLRQIPAQVVKDLPTLSVDKLNQAMTDGQVRSIFQPQGQGIEGFLFPDTYDIAEGADERTVVQTMVAAVRQGGRRGRSAGRAGTRRSLRRTRR